MRKLELGEPQQEKDWKWALEAFREIEDASNEAAIDIFEDFTVSNFTETYTLNAGTATTADVANFMATIIDAIKNRGTGD